MPVGFKYFCARVIAADADNASVSINQRDTDAYAVKSFPGSGVGIESDVCLNVDQAIFQGNALSTVLIDVAMNQHPDARLFGGFRATGCQR